MPAFKPILPRKATALKQSAAGLGSIAFQIGVLLAVERNRKQLTQEELGSRSGVDQAYISLIENGQKLPRSVSNEDVESVFELVGLGDAELQVNFVKWWRDNG